MNERLTDRTRVPAIPVVSVIVALACVVELCLWFMFRNNEVAAMRWLMRAAVPAITLVGIAVASQIIRYAGGLTLLVAGLWSLASFIQGSQKAPALVAGLLIAGAVFQAAAGGLLLFWPAFRSAFEERRNTQPGLATARKGVLALVGVAVLYVLAMDVANLVAL